MRAPSLHFIALLAVAAIAGCAPNDAPAPPARIAVAANFAATASALRDAHESAGGGRIDVILGSTGSLHAQITAGAPFDAFLAADTARPDRLVAEHLATAESRFVYAIGRLVLWSPHIDLVDPAGDVLRGEGFTHLAIADPKTAPYGAAAHAYLEGAGLLGTVAARLVTGQSVAQAYQYTASGNADLGFVAVSQVAGRGSHFIIPDDSHAPLEQAAVLLTDHPDAQAFLHFIRHDPDARAIIAAHGYGLPNDETRPDARRR